MFDELKWLPKQFHMNIFNVFDFCIDMFRPIIGKAFHNLQILTNSDYGVH